MTGICSNCLFRSEGSARAMRYWNPALPKLHGRDDNWSRRQWLNEPNLIWTGLTVDEILKRTRPRHNLI